MSDLSLGLDLGTSGIRSAVVDGDGVLCSMARSEYGPGPGADAWWQGAEACIMAQVAALKELGIDPDTLS